MGEYSNLKRFSELVNKPACVEGHILTEFGNVAKVHFKERFLECWFLKKLLGKQKYVRHVEPYVRGVHSAGIVFEKNAENILKDRKRLEALLELNSSKLTYYRIFDVFESRGRKIVMLECRHFPMNSLPKYVFFELSSNVRLQNYEGFWVDLERGRLWRHDSTVKARYGYQRYKTALGQADTTGRLAAPVQAETSR